MCPTINDLNETWKSTLFFLDVNLSTPDHAGVKQNAVRLEIRSCHRIEFKKFGPNFQPPACHSSATVETFLSRTKSVSSLKVMCLRRLPAGLAPLDFVILPSACSLSGHLLKFSFSLFSGIARGVEHHLAVQIVSWFFWTFHHQVIQVGSPPRAMECKKAMVTKPLCQHLPHSSVHHGCPKQKDQVLVTFSGICMIVLVRLIRNPHFDQVVQVTLDFQRFSEIFHQLLFRNIARLQHFASLAVSQILALVPGAWKGKHTSISSGLCRSLFRFGGSFAVVQGYAGLLLHIVWRSRRVRCRLGAGHGWTTGSAPTSNLHASLSDKEASEADLELGMAGQRGRHQHQIFMVMSLPNIVEQHLKHKVHHILRLLRKTHN